MITIHPRFRSEAEALEAAHATQDASTEDYRHSRSGDGQGLQRWAHQRIARHALQLVTEEARTGYAGPYRAAPDIATCPCAVCTWRREHREAGET